MPTDSEGLLDAPATAGYLGVTVVQLRDWRYRRTGPPYLKLGRRTVRYAKSDLDAWLRRHHVTAEVAS